MAVRPEEIASILREQIEQFESSTVSTDVGTVIDAGDGVARATGLANVRYSELLEFPNGSMGLALNLEEESVSAFEHYLGLFENRPYIGEVKRPQPPWPKGAV